MFLQMALVVSILQVPALPPAVVERIGKGIVGEEEKEKEKEKEEDEEEEEDR